MISIQNESAHIINLSDNSNKPAIEFIFQAGTNHNKICKGLYNEVSCNDVIAINPSDAKELNILPGKYAVCKTDQNKLKIGPIVGILSAKSKNNQSRTKVAHQYKELIECCNERGLIAFVFFIEEFDIRKNTVEGLTISNKQSHWIKRQFPLPDIVYNRIPYRSIENMSNHKKAIEFLQNSDKTYYFNSRFFDKWEVFMSLSADEKAKPFIPETKLLDRNNLQKFIDKYHSVYIKPRNNSRGKGIIKLEKITVGYRYTLMESKPRKWRNISSVKQLPILQLARKYIIQAGINLRTYQNRLFDLRVQVQKDGEGEWMTTGVGVRVAAPNQIVTHIPNGGRKANYRMVLEEIYSGDETKIDFVNNQLAEICSIVPAALEEKIGMNIGIVSLDIGLDSNDRLWLIEANSKPGKFDENDIRKVHTDTLVKYFTYCARVSPE